MSLPVVSLETVEAMQAELLRETNVDYARYEETILRINRENPVLSRMLEKVILNCIDVLGGESCPNLNIVYACLVNVTIIQYQALERQAEIDKLNNMFAE